MRAMPAAVARSPLPAASTASSVAPSAGRYRYRAQLGGFEGYPPRAHGRLGEAGRGFSVYQAINSSSPKLYTRRVIGRRCCRARAPSVCGILRPCRPPLVRSSSKSFSTCYLALSVANRDISSSWRETSSERSKESGRRNLTCAEPTALLSYCYER
jgi:hypothetical protein